MDSIKNGSNVITAALTGWDVTDVVVRRVSRQLTARLYRPINTKENLYSFLPSYWDSIFDDVTFVMVIRWANKASPTLTIMINAMPLNNLHCIYCIIISFKSSGRRHVRQCCHLSSHVQNLFTRCNVFTLLCTCISFFSLFYTKSISVKFLKAFKWKSVNVNR